MRPTRPIQITRAETRVPCARELAALQRDFERQSFVKLPALITRTLIGAIAGHLERASFGRTEHHGFGHDLSMAPNIASAALNFLLNDPALFDAIRAISGCARIGSFTGRVYRVADQDADGLGWHDDAMRDRLVALSINIGAGTYRGGRLELRDRNTGKILAQPHNRGFGSAILFRIGPSLEHRNSPVIGSVAKTAFAGWFMARPDYIAAATRALRRSGPRRHTARTRKPSTDGAMPRAVHARISPDLAWRRIGDETLVINIRSGKSYRLDETGGIIWKMLAEGAAAEAIARAISVEYKIAATTVRGDINLMLQNLARAGLIASLNPQKRSSKP